MAINLREELKSQKERREFHTRFAFLFVSTMGAIGLFMWTENFGACLTFLGAAGVFAVGFAVIEEQLDSGLERLDSLIETINKDKNAA